jgi:hypothetical protein
MPEDVEEFKLIIETREDYEEVIAALDESIEAASLLSTSIARLAEALEAYEEKHKINRDFSD